MTKYYIDCKYNCYIGDEEEDSDDGPYSGFSHEVRSDHQFKVYNKKIDYPEASFDTDIENPHWIIVIYSDGGTFGRTDGYVQILPPMEENECKEVAGLIYESCSIYCKYGSKEDRKEQTSIIQKINTILKAKDKHFYMSWVGYFASLQSVMILRSDGYYYDAS